MTRDEGRNQLRGENRALREVIEVMEHRHMQMSELPNDADHPIVH